MPSSPEYERLTRTRIEGYAAGVRATLDALDRAGCLTTTRARRFVDRMRRDMTASESSDMVESPEREAPTMTPDAPAVGYRIEPCPECKREVCVTWQGYRVDWPELPEGEQGDVGLTILPGGQVLMAGMGNPRDNHYRLHDHQPPELEG